ncbi:MAG: MarR family transcriptional regulator [Oscillospiraceae bacterium]|nr:MarR family transcriptional regulator [Oscillospiraceae bacterium]
MADRSDDRRIGLAIASLSNLMRRKGPGSLPIAHEYNLTRTQSWIIGYIYQRRGEDVFQNDIERSFQMTGATATNILKRMERDGLIIRESLPTDRRKKKLILTERAVEIYKEVKQLLENNEVLMRQGLTEEELDCFFGVIKKISDNLRK